MGMFDYVKYKAPCWKCGKEITEWQSKDSDCLMRELSVKQVSSFYASCFNRVGDKVCNAWNEYKVIPKEVEVILDEVASKIKTN